MSKAVLISIRPEWCRKILDGEKTVEIRKSYPKAKDIPYPFKCYIYCCKEKPSTMEVIRPGELVYDDGEHQEFNNGGPIFIKTPSSEFVSGWQQGKIIGEFVCDNIESLSRHSPDASFGYEQPLSGCTCVPTKQLYVYGMTANKGLRELYGWHISQLKKYKWPPAELAFFGLKRPPQSWCYVQEWEG